MDFVLTTSTSLFCFVSFINSGRNSKENYSSFYIIAFNSNIYVICYVYNTKAQMLFSCYPNILLSYEKIVRKILEIVEFQSLGMNIIERPEAVFSKTFSGTKVFFEAHRMTTFSLMYPTCIKLCENTVLPASMIYNFRR